LGDRGLTPEYVEKNNIIILHKNPGRAKIIYEEQNPHAAGVKILKQGF
jgi:hypothetical protein